MRVTPGYRLRRRCRSAQIHRPAWGLARAVTMEEAEASAVRWFERAAVED